jgi:hypothetical protein
MPAKKMLGFRKEGFAAWEGKEQEEHGELMQLWPDMQQGGGSNTFDADR